VERTRTEELTIRMHQLGFLPDEPKLSRGNSGTDSMLEETQDLLYDYRTKSGNWITAVHYTIKPWHFVFKITLENRFTIKLKCFCDTSKKLPHYDDGTQKIEYIAGFRTKVVIKNKYQETIKEFEAEKVTVPYRISHSAYNKCIRTLNALNINLKSSGIIDWKPRELKINSIKYEYKERY